MRARSNKDYQQLIQFIPFFESEEPKYTITDQVCLDPFHYASEFNQFIMLASDTLTIIGLNWQDFRKEYEDSNEGSLAHSVAQMDLDTIQKWMTTIIRSERYCSGTYAQMIDEGVFLAMLKRIKEIITTP